MYNLLLYTSKMQEDKLYNIYNFRYNEQFDIALMLVLLHCMRAHGLSLDGEGTSGDKRELMEPHA
jgi:hypothetical protein